MKKKPIYNINDILVFVGDSHKFETGKKYKISNKGSIDYDHEDVGTRECLFFENCDFGCYDDYADQHFIKVEDDREHKINKLLEWMNKDQIYEIASKLADEAFGDKGYYYYSQRQELTCKFNEMLLSELESLNIKISEW